MEITVSHEQGKVPVAVIKTHGNVDGSNYEQIIEKAKDVIGAGARDVLLDLSETEYMSTAGIVALQFIARLLRGEAMTDAEHGWEAIHAIARDGMGSKQKHLKLLKPQAKILTTLEVIGLKDSFEIFSDQAEAISSF